jgi:hypothetical protein
MDKRILHNMGDDRVHFIGVPDVGDPPELQANATWERHFANTFAVRHSENQGRQPILSSVCDSLSYPDYFCRTVAHAALRVLLSRLPSRINL